uniref:breast cancer type 2 susceptibility protein isoform X3 n=1 Tax=Solea senegalensis TaxID=28829 RepID=UPI001CD8F77D|nr:breast cancer type 2 susceptibility protein isoform X3 [Solea senegalensis]
MVCSVRTCKDYTTSPGMDLPSKNMYDEFKDEIWKELGPLDPDWFNVLTVQASTVEDNVSDELCANQEAHFKAPLDKTAPDSQLFSTPKAFRHSRVGSPETEAEQSFTAEEKEILPWKETQSPHLFRMAKERVAEAKYGGICPQSQDGYDLLHRMPKSPVNYAKKIAETLGAQVDSDISWTSSLNTPPAVPSTLILSKPDESPCPVSVSAADKNVVFVRKLFPSLSNSSRVVAASSKNSDISVQRGGLISPESPRVWRQKLPDAIEDSDVRRTVANVLDGAENVLSIFFSNSGSALRKVKTDRVQRKQIVLTKEQGCIFTGDSNSNSDVVTEQRTDDQDLEKLSSPPPLPSRDIRTTQWSPLSLSEIPPWTTDASCCEVENNVLTERLQRDSSLLAGTTLKSPHSGFIKKKRKFIYTVDASKTQDEGREIPSQIIDTSALVPDSGNDESVKLLVNDGDENETQKLPLSVKSKLQDLDMSQLCRDFAQDFSQMLDADKVSLASEDNPQNGFSASACLTAMRQAKEKARRANLHHDCDAVSHGKLGPATDESYSVNEGTISDSGFQSAVADVSHLTTTLPSTENCVQTQQFTNRRNGKPLDDIEREAETDVKLPSATEENQTLENGEPGGPSCAEETDYTLCQVGDGFKTASNKSIRISSLHLERAKRLFEENEAEKTLRDQPATGGEIIGIGNGPAKNTISNSNQAPSSSIENTADISCQLTASQKADVTELCTLLEEADSQFEFTQFKMTKPQQQDNTTSLNKVDKELDPDFLLGIDFDESFSVDAEKHTTKTAMTEKTASFMDAETSGEVLKVTSKSFGRNKNAAVASSSSEHISEGGSGVSSAKPQNLNKSHIQENNNPLMPATGFRTATGNILRVSRKCMSKARALFADLDGDLTDHKSTDEHRGKVDAKTEESWVTSVAKGLRNGFQTASGKGVSISAKAMQEADALFKDCNISHNNTALSVKLKTNMVQSPSFSSNARKHLEPKSIQEIKDVVVDNVESQSFDFKDAPAVTSAVSSHVNLPLTTQHLSSPSCTTSKSCGSSANNQSSSGGGFCTASGKKVSVSANALKKAECLLNEIHVLDSVKEHLTQKGDALKTGKPTDHALQNGGFQMASGKGVVVSSAALQKAKSLLSECEAFEDKICVKPNNSGFLAASGKHVTFPSSEALNKAKALFSDITLSEETRKVPDTKKCSEEQNGARVCVSRKNLLTAADVVEELDDDDSIAMQEADAFFKDCNKECEESVARGKKTSKQKHDEMLSNTSEGHGSASSEFEKGLVVKRKNVTRHNDVESHKGALTKAADSTDGNSYSAFSDFGNSGGFCTASGKKVSVSDEAMTKAKSLLNDSAAFKDTNERMPPKEDNLPPQNPDEGVAFSFDAQKKAKSQCSEAESKINIKSTRSRIPVSCSTPVNGGFLAASGKPVAFSSESLQRAKAVFNDIDFCSKTPSISDTKRRSHVYDQTTNTAGNLTCGFLTAGGAKVHVSQTNMLKAKTLFKDVAEEESRRSNSDPTPTHESDVRRNNFNLTTVRDEQETRHSVPRVVKSFQPLQETDHENETLQDSRMHNCISNREKALADESELKEGKREETFTSPWVGNPHAEEMGNVSRSEVNHTSSSEGPRFKRTEETSVIILDLGGCTKTQQEFLAQEALDCTKALLEDESLAGKILLPTLEGERLQDNPGTNPRSVEGQRRRGKRVGEDADMTVQPPLKRQLLEEFDRTVDEPTLQPQKTCPNSVIKDRRVFKYSVSHHPNITGPHGSEKHYVERRQSIAGRGTSAHSKIPTFVPPFLKNAKTETRRNTVLNVGAKTPSAFVPPFKKQRTVVQESSSRPHDEKDIHLRLFGPPSNSNGLAPPAKKPQSGADVSGDKGEEDVKTMTFPDTTDNPTMNSPADCVSDESAAEEVFSRSQDMFLNLESVEMARDMQDMRIRKKKRQTIRPLPGSLFLAKTSGVSRVPLKAAVNGKPPVRCSPKQLYECGVHQHVCEISSENAEMFRFSLKQFLNMEVFTEHGGVQLADGGWLVPSNDGTAGKQEFYRALCDTPGVDPKLMSEEWVFNHYRWIVWKQASMERSFPETMGGLRLTPEQVLLQLKYRYDVEIDHSRRPALRKIMERDDTAAKTLLLCVCGVVSSGRSPNEQSHSDAKAPQGSDAKVENSSAVVWLTDGWYSVKAQLDEPLTAMLHKGRLAVGGKLIVYGAQLVGSQDACSPLEAPESLMLKICANSTRPARWDTKLGFHKDPRPFLLPLSSLFSNGGPVGCVDITVLRSYPVQWMERKPDGGVVFRSVRAEEKEARRYSKHKQKAMEILFAKIQSEFEKEQIGNDKPQRRRRTMSRQDIVSLQDGEELHEAVGDDPAYFEAHLSERQLATLQTYRRSLMEKQQAELQDRYRRAVDAESSDGGCPNRDVTPVWRLCVADSMDQRARAYQLNLWRPPSDLQSMLKEGCRYRVYNVTTSDGKRRSGVETVHLTGTKKTQFQDLQASREWLSTHFQPRVSTNFVELQDIEYQPLCGEVDLAGYIISIIDEQGSTPAFYLADGSLNFVKVRSFSSFAHSGLEDVVRLRVLLALSNLQLRGQSTHPSPVVYAGDLTVFSTNPKEAHLQESLCQLRNLVQAQENFFQAAEEKLSLLIKSDDVVSAVSSPALLHPRTPVVTTDGRQDARTSQPIRSLGSVTPMSTNPPAASSSTENKKDPKSLKRRRALDYLSRIPSPPSLSCLSSAASPCVKKTFNPPRRSATPGTLTTPARKPAPPLPLAEDEWVNDEELAMIDTQNLQVGNSL